MTELFKQHHWNLEIKCNLKIADYLDITFDLAIGLFEPYNKTTVFLDMLMQNQITRRLY